MGGKNVILTGTSGMIGGCALYICLNNLDVARAIIIGRRTVWIEHPKLREILQDDFIDYSVVADAFKDQDVALYCIGVYTGAVSDDAFRRITVDYTQAFAKALYQNSPQVAFCFLSGQGADRTAKSRTTFARYKGMAENGLLDAGFSRVHIFRPGYIYPVTPRKEPNVMYSVSRFLYPFIRHIYPDIGISSEDLATAMVHAGLNGTGAHGTPVWRTKTSEIWKELGDNFYTQRGWDLVTLKPEEEKLKSLGLVA